VNVKKVLSRKPLKFLTLLLTAMFIASASAAVYYSITMQPAVTISEAAIKFVEGNDWPSGSQLGDNGTFVILALKAYPNATLTYDNPLNISNTDASNSHQFRLRHVSITPATGNQQVSNFTFINFVVKNKAGVSQASFNYTTTGDTWNTPSTTSYQTVPASTMWIIYVETKAAAGATKDLVAIIKISVDVLE